MFLGRFIYNNLYICTCKGSAKKLFNKTIFDKILAVNALCCSYYLYNKNNIIYG